MLPAKVVLEGRTKPEAGLCRVIWTAGNGAVLWKNFMVVELSAGCPSTSPVLSDALVPFCLLKVVRAE